MSKIILENDNKNNVLTNDTNKISDLESSKQIVDEFASAFPDWNLVPPLQVIKRVRRSI